MKGHHWFYYKHIGVEILRQSGPVFVANLSACSLGTGHVACANDKWLEWVKLRSQWLPGVPAVFQQSSFPQPSPLLLTGLIIWHFTRSTSRSPLFHASSCCPPNWWLNTLERPSLLFYLFLYISIYPFKGGGGSWRASHSHSPSPQLVLFLFSLPPSLRLFFSSLFIKFPFKAPERKDTLLDFNPPAGARGENERGMTNRYIKSEMFGCI